MFLDLHVGELSEPLTGRRWRRAEIADRMLRRVARYRACGMARDDRVFIHYGNSLEFFVDVLAVWTLGACAIPLDPRLTTFEIETLANAARPRFSLWNAAIDHAAEEALTRFDVRLLDTSEADRSPIAPAPSHIPDCVALDQPALVLFTSGTTGQPKGVVHTHRSLRARWLSLRDHLGLRTFRRTLCVLPTHFGHGLICNCLFPWLSGLDLFVLPAFQATLLIQLGRIIDENGITFMSSVPTVWRLALKVAKPPWRRTLERVICGSAPLSAVLWKAIQDWAGTRDVLNAYGITETGSWVAGTTVGEFTPEDGLVGLPWGAVIRILPEGHPERMPGTEGPCAAGDSGRVWINTPALMQGYLGRDDLTRQAVSHGWLSTGDIGVLDDRGWLYLRGREREEINRGGMKIFPGDIDAVLERFHGTVDVCSFGYEDPLYGENVGVAVVLKTPDEQTLSELIALARRHLGDHRLPQRWYVVEEVARTSRGKVNRARMAERCAGLTPIAPSAGGRGSPREND